MSAKAASTAVASPWATWHVGRPRRVFASSMQGRSSRMRLAVWTISIAQPAGSTASGSPLSTSATSSDRMGRSRLPGANRLVPTAASTAGARPGDDQPAQRGLHLLAAGLERPLEIGELGRGGDGSHGSDPS